MPVNNLEFVNLDILIFLPKHPLTSKRPHPAIFGLEVCEIELMICHSFYHAFVVLPILSELHGIDCGLLTLQSQQKSFVFQLDTLKLLFP